MASVRARKPPIEEARQATNEHLRSEREEADNRKKSGKRPAVRELTDAALDRERDALDAAVRGRDEVLAWVSHDLRNLITAIGLKAAVLERELPRCPDESSLASDLAREIGSACVLMERWAGDLVDLASLNAGSGVEIALAPHLADELVLDSIELFLARAAKRGLELRTEVEEDLPKVSCDRNRIVQVLANLLGNATKFTPSGGSITVSVARRDDMIGFTISDTGPGVAPEDRERIFERGWHTHMKTGGGAGLGLYISKQVIERHQGRIWVDDGERAGASFCFTLPVVR